MKSVCIIGAGNLGCAIAEGLLETGYVLPENLTITRRKPQLLTTFSERGVTTLSDNNEAVKNKDIVILAVKPYQALEVLQALSGNLKSQATIVSVVTGIAIKDLQQAAGEHVSVVRAMPNTAIAIRESITCVAANNAPEGVADEISELFDQLGQAVIIDEELMEAATVLGACGIAYALRFIRAATQGGIEIGFDAKTAALIASQTAKGAAALLLEKGAHPEQEIDKVTTPKGCTIAGLNEMEHQGFSSSLIRGILSSYQKIS